MKAPLVKTIFDCLRRATCTVQIHTVEESLINQTPFFGSTGTKVMITTGRPDSSATKTEVVGVVNGESCADLG